MTAAVARQIAAHLAYTGYTTLTVLSTGDWFSPSDSARVPAPDGVEEWRFKWGRDEEGDYCYCPAARFRDEGTLA